MDIIDPELIHQCDNNIGTCIPQFHQPGANNQLSKRLLYPEGRTCSTFEQLLKLDIPDMTDSTFNKKCPVGSSKIAMVAHPGEDYHFYRQDKDGYWSHKDGMNKVKRYDAKGRLITNPQKAARDYRPNGSFLNYKDFCNFYCVPRRHTIKLNKWNY